ncbi:hypothetical protein ABZ016_24665 [Streptomyces sp. NPDC006372]
MASSKAPIRAGHVVAVGDVRERRLRGPKKVDPELRARAVRLVL